MPNHYPAGSFNAPAAVSTDVLDELRDAGVACDTSEEQRAEHARDWWPRLIPEVARGQVESWPGVVVRATSAEDVSSTLRVALERRIAVTAQGGRSGVVGGAVPTRGAIALDMTGLNRIHGIDATSGTVAVDAGVFGPELEGYLKPLGFTVGHFPQSFDLATVGGWIACRGAGQYSNRYGKIEDIVRALTVVLVGGDVIRLGGRAPREALGPGLMQLFVGSEGTLGVITEATLVIRPVAACEQRRAFSFDSFDAGMDACRRIVQRDARPAVLRLYDEIETRRHFDVDGCALIVLDEGDEGLVAATMVIVAGECATARALDESYVEHWLTHRNDVSALAPLWERGLVVDTIEVAGSWAILATLRRRVTAALLDTAGTLAVSVHQSHAYIDGACLYFTFAGQRDDSDAFYRAAWDAAIAEVMSLGASISHHHGVGRSRARFIESALASAFGVLESVKSALDPHGLLNPGVLGLGAEPW